MQVELRKKKSSKNVWPKRRNNQIASEKMLPLYFAIENLNDGYFIPGYNNYIKEPIGEPSVKEFNMDKRR